MTKLNLEEISSFNNFINDITKDITTKEITAENLYNLKSICNSYIHTCEIFKLGEGVIYKVEEHIDDIVKNIDSIIESAKELTTSEISDLCDKIKTYEPLDTLFGRTTLLLIDCLLLNLEKITPSLASDIKSDIEKSTNDINNLMGEIDDIIDEIDGTLENPNTTEQHDDFVFPTKEELENDLKNIMEELFEESTSTTSNTNDTQEDKQETKQEDSLSHIDWDIFS